MCVATTTTTTTTTTTQHKRRVRVEEVADGVGREFLRRFSLPAVFLVLLCVRATMPATTNANEVNN